MCVDINECDYEHAGIAPTHDRNENDTYANNVGSYTCVFGPVSIMSELIKRLVMNLVAVKIVRFLRRFECKCIKLVFYLIETKCFLGFYLFRALFISKKWRL